MSTETKPPAGERETPEQIALAIIPVYRPYEYDFNEEYRKKCAAAIRDYAASLTAERDELKRELVHIRGVLREHEWDSHAQNSQSWCCVCKSDYPIHEPNCWLSELLPPSTSKEQKK